MVLYSCTYTPPPPKNSSHLDHSRLGVKNKFFQNKIAKSPTDTTFITKVNIIGDDELLLNFRA